MLPAPTDDQVFGILRAHGLSCDAPVERSPHEGVVNHVRFVGDLCIRTLKENNYASDIWTESVAVPAVRASGANVPELLVFDPSERTFPTLITIYRRVPGEPFGQLREVADAPSIFRELGRQIGIWHRGVKSVSDPHGYLDIPEWPNPRQVIANNAERLSFAQLRWVDALVTRLEKAEASVRGFVHWDLHTHNVLVHENEVSSVIDWGDAGWGDAAINFHCLSPRYLPELLEGFGCDDPQFIGRCLLGMTMYTLNDAGRPEDRSQPFRNSGHRRWKSLQALCARDLPDTWRQWLGEPLT